MGEYVLILGVTGVAKNNAFSQLKKYIDSQGIELNYKVVDFEKEFLAPVLAENEKDLYSYLDDTNLRQRQLWLEAWKRFKPVLKKLKKNRDKHIFLSLHGVNTREFTGTRSAVNIQSIVEDFSPTKIVTLIDNVYLKWSRTWGRAEGEPKRGQPTLEQLSDARRAEIFIGDVIAGHQEIKPRHYVLAVCHPARTLYRLLFGSKDIRTVYLSFPISGPRRLLDNGDNSGISEVNGFLKEVNTFELKNPKIACFCPLTIDELPLVKNLPVVDEKDEEKHLVNFSLESKRWNVKDFWSDQILLCDSIPPEISIPLKQIKEALGFISSDVGLRDYRLVRQAKYLIVFNPWFKGEETQGVRNEISMAVLCGLSVYIYQDPQHDNNGDAKKFLLPNKGTLGVDPKSHLIRFYESIERALQQVLV